MPFSETIDGERVVTTKAQWDHFFDKWIKRALSEYDRHPLVAERSAAIPGNFVRGIVSDLSTAFLVIADLTGSKPNVFYELGIRHALRTGTILITQDLNSMPSDLQGYYAFEYTYTDKAHEYELHYSQFAKELHEKIDAFIDGKIPSDSPVSDFLGFRKEAYDRQLENEKEKLKRLCIEAGRSIRENFEVCELILEAVTQGKEIEYKNWPIIDIGPTDALYSELLSVDLDIMGDQITQPIRKIVSDHRRALLVAKHHWDTFFLLPSNDGAESLVGVLEYFVKAQKPVFDESWDGIISSISNIRSELVITENNEQRVISRKKDER